MTKNEALKMALEALDSKYIVGCGEWRGQQLKAITAMKEALAQPAQEPVAWIEHHKAGDNLVWDEPNKGTPLYTTPPQRTWVGLTDEEREEIENRPFSQNDWLWSYACAIEAKLKEKNT